MNRRDLLKATAIAGTALAIPASVTSRLAAQPRTGLPRDAQLAAIAKKAQEQTRARGMLWREDYVGIADYGLRSSEPRFHFVNMEAGTVNSYLVSHGDGSDPEHDGWLNWFSNINGSNCSSKGTYATFGWYTGRYGTSIRLEGLDPTNSNALDRAIVMHRAKYAEREHLEKWGRLGRSNGCFAMGAADFQLALLQLGGGRCLYTDAIGLQEDGTIIPPQVTERPAGGQLPENVELLQREKPTGIEQINPGVY